MSMIKVSAPLVCCLLLSSCGTKPITPSPGHLKEAPAPVANIPAPVQQSAQLRPPKPSQKLETYSVTVYRVPVQSLLFALARDAKLNVDIHPGISGEVTLNALNQTLPQLLSRISKQVDMRFEIDGPNLVVIPDSPVLRNYKVDYVNIARNTTGNVSIATQIATAGSTGGDSGGGNNNSTTSVTNKSDNNFWETLAQNIRDILRETDKIVPDSASENTAEPAADGKPAAKKEAPRTQYREAASVIVNAETGFIAVRATGRQHDKIQEFLDLVLSSAKRQVLIEATVIEVQLNDQYQQGINWQSLRSVASRDPTTGAPIYSTGFNLAQTQAGSALTATSTSPLPVSISAPNSIPGLFALQYANATSAIGNIAATIQLLESFGKVKVLSSPKISVLNNQTALLKVVDNNVYFTITATTSAATVGVPATTTYTSELHTVPVGFVMSVTPQIADTDEVTINVRPSISRIIGYVQDPNPALINAVVPVVSRVPVIQTREMESILKVSSGQIAVMGGLMQDSVNNTKDSIPGLNRIPVVGAAFSYRDEKANKTELVIFMRPVVIKEASLSGDYKEFRNFLPDSTPLSKPPYADPGTLPAAKPKKVSK